MNNLQIFLKQFTNEKRKRSIIKNVVIISALTALFSQNEIQYSISIRNLASSILILTAIFSFSTVFDFNKIHKIKKYISLPLNTLEYIASLYISLSILIFVDKALFLVALALILSSLNLNVLAVSIISVFLMTAVLLNLLVSISKKSIILKLISFISIIASIGMCYINIDIIYLYVGLVTILALNLLILSSASITDLVYYPKSRGESRIFKNYYVNVVKNNKVFLINSVFIFIMAIVYYMFLFKSETIFLMALPLAMITGNKVLATLISADKETLKTMNIVPGKEMYTQYFKFNLVFFYFQFILMAFVTVILFNFNYLISIIITVICPPIIAFVNTYLEKNHPILIWSDLNQLWKSPRNYISFAITYAIVLALLFAEMIVF